jgi:hypothetical protein
MAGLFKKIAKGILVGVGSVVSLAAPKLGSGIISLGTNIKVGTTTKDPVSEATKNLVTAVKASKAAQTASELSFSVSGVMDWLKENPIAMFAAIGVLIFLGSKLLKRGRR